MLSYGNFPSCPDLIRTKQDSHFNDTESHNVGLYRLLISAELKKKEAGGQQAVIQRDISIAKHIFSQSHHSHGPQSEYKQKGPTESFGLPANVWVHLPKVPDFVF